MITVASLEQLAIRLSFFNEIIWFIVWVWPVSVRFVFLPWNIYADVDVVGMVFVVETEVDDIDVCFDNDNNDAEEEDKLPVIVSRNDNDEEVVGNELLIVNDPLLLLLS